jgi:2-oxoisovalerate dehydrogenase E1 component beta subunit
VRVTAPDTPVPYSPPLEDFYVPGKDDVLEVARKLLDY